MAPSESEAAAQATQSPCHATPDQAPEKDQEKTLPKLTPAEFRQYNRLADKMEYFHNHFRATWSIMMTACESGKRPKNMSIRQFLSMGQQFVSQLEMHHNIEETYLYPQLAKKMPAFRKELELIDQHKQIHKGMDKMEEYLNQCSTGERELRLSEFKVILSDFEKVLWQHLDDEVKQLGAEEMRKHYTIEELRRIMM